jgi:ribulose-phosphate 3-epimerase
MQIKIAPSILSADFGKLNEEIALVAPFVDLMHIDVMDGHFVPNITIGVPVVASLKSDRPLDCHLMIENPKRYIDAFAESIKKSQGDRAGESNITVHLEACENPSAVLRQIKDAGLRAGLSLSPPTPAEKIAPFLDEVDLVLIMSVNPGFGGQTFIPEALEKIKYIRAVMPELDIEVDGGINAETGALCKEAGANILVAGSYIFNAEDRKARIESLK